MVQVIAKIEDRISMIRKKAIMTIKTKIERITNLFEDRDWPLFNSEKAREIGADYTSIGLLSYTTGDINTPANKNQLIDISIVYLEHFLFHTINIDTHFKIWLFITHGTCLPDNRITRYKRLWKLSDMLSKKSFTQKMDTLINTEWGIRFAGVVKIDQTNYIDSLPVLLYYSSALIVTHSNLEDENEIVNIYNNSFTNRSSENTGEIEWMDLCLCRCKQGDIVIRCGYESERNEIYMDCFMESERIKGIGLIM